MVIASACVTLLAHRIDRAICGRLSAFQAVRQVVQKHVGAVRWRHRACTSSAAVVAVGASCATAVAGALHASAWAETMVHVCWLVLSELLLQALLTSRDPDGGLRVAPTHGSLTRGDRAYVGWLSVTGLAKHQLADVEDS